MSNETTIVGVPERAQRLRINSRARKATPILTPSNVNFDISQFILSLREFCRLQPNDIADLVDSSRLATIEPGTYITTEGEEEGGYGFIVVSGRIAMLKTSSSGKELIVELLQVGDIFGLLLMLAGDPLPAQLSARSIQRSKILWVPIKGFSSLLNAHPRIFEEIISHLLNNLHSSYGLSRGLAHDRVEVRIAAVLSNLENKLPVTAPPQQANTIDLTRQQLADLTGTTPETAIRITRAMQRDGLIDIQRPGKIKIVNLNGLHELTDI